MGCLAGGTRKLQRFYVPPETLALESGNCPYDQTHQILQRSPTVRCSTFKAEMESGHMEAEAIHQDRVARVRSGQFTAASRVPLFKEAKDRWHMAASKYEAHRAAHFQKSAYTNLRANETALLSRQYVKSGVGKFHREPRTIH